VIKAYRLNAIRPLLPLASEDLPLLASFYPLTDGVEPWLIRYVVNTEGFWLQANDQLGSNHPPLSFHEFEGMTGFTKDELEPGKLEGMGYRWGLPGGKPILPLPFTAKQFLEFANRLGDVARGVMPLNTDDAAQFVTELAQRNPDAAELAQIILSGVAPTDAATPAPVVDAVEPAKVGPVANWRMQIQAEATAHCLRLRKSGANPTRHSILEPMAKWCRDNDIRTDTKINPSANYLRTHVLGGKYWDVPT
jgi:hypothetical protein